MTRRGFTILELLVVMIMIGVLMGLAIPRLMDAFAGNNKRAARSALVTLVAKARGTAVARGCRSAVHFTSGSNGSAWVTVCKVTGTGIDTLGGVDPVAARFNVTITASRDSVTYAPSGISFDGLSTTLRVISSQGQDSVFINQIGKVVQ
jgi:prepilin-type N-terminal cleavage/methylation domain-containing protein